MMAQRIRVAEAQGRRYLLDRNPGLFQQVAGMRHAFLNDPFSG
jgi:hypothetical protein